MALEFIDGLDHYTSEGQMGLKWDPSTNPGGFTTGRYGGQCARTGNPEPLVSRNLGAVATRIVGWALRYEGGTPSGTPVVMAFLDGTSTQVDLRIDSTGHLVVTRNGTVLATSSSTISGDIWYYIEFQVTIHSSAGAYRLDVSPTGGATTTWLSATGVNTQATANATMTGFEMRGGVGFWLDTDDVYALNSSGSANTTFLGPCRVFTSLPSADGASTSWTPNSGSTHYTQVDDAEPDSDSTYVSAGIVGYIDTYQFPDIAPVGNVYGVQLVLSARKDDTGARTICAEYRSSGATNYDGASISPTTTYAMYRHIWDTDPATSAAWTAAGINGGEFGAKILT